MELLHVLVILGIWLAGTLLSAAPIYLILRATGAKTWPLTHNTDAAKYIDMAYAWILAILWPMFWPVGVWYLLATTRADRKAQDG